MRVPPPSGIRTTQPIHGVADLRRHDVPRHVAKPKEPEALDAMAATDGVGARIVQAPAEGEVRTSRVAFLAVDPSRLEGSQSLPQAQQETPVEQLLGLVVPSTLEEVDLVERLKGISGATLGAYLDGCGFDLKQATTYLAAGGANA
jgi:hypothetical protein